MDANHQVHRVAEVIDSKFNAAMEKPDPMQDLHTSAAPSNGFAPAQQPQFYQQSDDYPQQSHGYDQGYWQHQSDYYGYQSYPQDPGYQGGGPYQPQEYGSYQSPQSYYSASFD